MAETESEKQYKTTSIIVKTSQEKLTQYCESQTQNAKLFENAVIFRCRQIIFANYKKYEGLNENELEVLAEFANVDTAFMFEEYWKLPTYEQFDKMFKVTNNFTFLL